MTAVDHAARSVRPRSADAVVMAWCGPADHGITMFGRQLAAAVAVDETAAGVAGAVLTAAGPAGLDGLVEAVPVGTRLLHLQVNDWLFADGELAARDRLLAFAGRLRDRGTGLSVTLHDLPHTAVSEALYRRRAATYAAVAEAAVGVVVSSRHEEHLLGAARAAVGATGTLPVAVIPLPIDAAGPAGPPPRPADGPATVGIFGFVYPGKGHDVVVDALAGLAPAVRVLAVGRASTGHEDMVETLAAQARRHGISFGSTGFVADADVDTVLRSVDVPVAPAAEVSASGSINSWLAAGRRPLTLAGDYTRELAARHPGAVLLYEPDELRDRVVAALADPGSTWLGDGAVVGAGIDVVARRYVAWWRAMADRC